MTHVRWGLLSTANINRRVIPAIRASRRGTLAAVASRDDGRARAYAERWEIPEAFGSYEAMLASDTIDAVYLSLPNSLHAEWTIRALHAGKHVLCEKPFALTLAEADAMSAAAREANRVLAEAFMYRHHPQTKRVGDLVASGRLGDITLLRSVFNFAFDSRDNVRLEPELGGGCLWDVGVYPISIAQYVFGGTPVQVFGRQWLGDTGVDEVFAGQLSYADGSMAQIGASFRTPFHTQLEILGTEGRLLLDRPFTHVEEGSLLLFDADGEAEQLAVPMQPLYLGEIEDMHAAILDGASPYLSLAESRGHVATVLALYESARQNRPIDLV